MRRGPERSAAVHPPTIGCPSWGARQCHAQGRSANRGWFPQAMHRGCRWPPRGHPRQRRHHHRMGSRGPDVGRDDCCRPRRPSWLPCADERPRAEWASGAGREFHRRRPNARDVPSAARAMAHPTPRPALNRRTSNRPGTKRASGILTGPRHSQGAPRARSAHSVLVHDRGQRAAQPFGYGAHRLPHCHPGSSTRPPWQVGGTKRTAAGPAAGARRAALARDRGSREWIGESHDQAARRPAALRPTHRRSATERRGLPARRADRVRQRRAQPPAGGDRRSAQRPPQRAGSQGGPIPGRGAPDDREAACRADQSHHSDARVPGRRNAMRHRPRR